MLAPGGWAACDAACQGGQVETSHGWLGIGAVSLRQGAAGQGGCGLVPAAFGRLRLGEAVLIGLVSAGFWSGGVWPSGQAMASLGEAVMD